LLDAEVGAYVAGALYNEYLPSNKYTPDDPITVAAEKIASKIATHAGISVDDNLVAPLKHAIVQNPKYRHDLGVKPWAFYDGVG
jgi:hypothetical protein